VLPNQQNCLQQSTIELQRESERDLAADLFLQRNRNRMHQVVPPVTKMVTCPLILEKDGIQHHWTVEFFVVL